jgi:hypothetical protein
MMNKTRCLCLCLGLTIAAGCEEQPRKPPATVVDLARLQALYRQGAAIPFGVGADAVFSAGFDPEYFLAAPNTISVAGAYTEKVASAYMTTDLWLNFPAVWIQPMYVLVNGAGKPVTLTNPDGSDSASKPWIFSVGPQSRFWSPYWRVHTVNVGQDKIPDSRFRSVREVLAANLPITPGPGRLVTIAPPDMAPSKPETFLLPPPAKPETPATPTMPAKPFAWPTSWPVTQGQAWLDGQAVSFLDFGTSRFEWNEEGEVLDQPLFFFFVQDPTTHAWVSASAIPRIGGTGPLYARRPALAPTGQPSFGSFWRLWAARLPPTAQVFVPSNPEVMQFHERVARQEVQLAEVARDPTGTDPELDDAMLRHAFQIVLDRPGHSGKDCVLNAATGTALDQCLWLDSQAAIESNLPRESLLPSEIVVTCPYLSLPLTAEAR